MSKRIKAWIILLIFILTAGLVPMVASAHIQVNIETDTTIETEIEDTTSRSTDLSEYTSTVTTTTTTTTSSSHNIYNFHPVRRIKHVPDSAIIGVPLRLTGTVYPRFATNRRIVWDVYDAGTTMATITGDNVLNVRATGTVTVRAIIHNGNYAQPDFRQNFSVRVIVPRFDRAPAMVTNLGQHAEFPNSGNFRDLYSLSLNEHEFFLTDDNERILLFGYPGYERAVGSIIEGSNVIRLYRSFLTFIPDGMYTLSATFRYERANGRRGRAYAINETIFVLDRTANNEIPQTGNTNFVPEATVALIVSVLGMGSILVLHKREAIMSFKTSKTKG